jgi:hypothetical protein
LRQITSIDRDNLTTATSSLTTDDNPC